MERFGRDFPQAVQVQPGNSSGPNKFDVNGKEKPGGMHRDGGTRQHMSNLL